MNGLRALQRFARPAPARAVCELCAEPLGPEHRHVVALAEPKLLCACRACALLFPAGPEGRYRGVPEEVRVAPGFAMSEAEWTELGVPVGLMFCFHQSSAGRWAAFFPSPAGATEAAPLGPAWLEFVRQHPLLSSMQSDVEALLVRRQHHGDFEAFLAPIDVCYRLVAVVRQYWRGFDGGDQVRQEIEALFARLRAKASGSGAAALFRAGASPGAAGDRRDHEL